MNRAIPLWAYLAAFLVQTSFLAWLILDRALLLASGTEFRLAVVPVDPRDFLRGDYVVLSYPISRLDSGTLGGDDIFDRGQAIFLALRRDGDRWVPGAIHRDRPSGEFGLAGKVTSIYSGTGQCGDQRCSTYEVAYNIEKFFVPEGKGRALETLRNNQRLEVDVAVGANGRAALKRLLVDGTPTFHETFLGLNLSTSPPLRRYPSESWVHGAVRRPRQRPYGFPLSREYRGGRIMPSS